jgi:C-terminal processing protease CtpA/Prc
MKKSFILLILIISLFTACKKDEPGDEPEPPDVTATMARDTLNDLMNQWYLWYDHLPLVNKDDYDDPYELLEALRYKALDKWSFVADYDEYNAEMSGTFVGHGYRIGIDTASTARIAMIYNNSPLYKAGVRRGWIVKKINGVDIAPLLIAGGTAYSDLIGPAEAGVTNTFLFKKPDGSEVTIISTKESFSINTVLLCDTIHLKTGAVAGHIVFESFIDASKKELETAFTYLKAQSATDLILDLRYNSGGYLDIAQQLASFIAGNSKAGLVFCRLLYNDKNSRFNSTINFLMTSYSLGVPRVVVITSRYTASASEAIINGLKPHISLVTTGDTTYGKPVGANGWLCAKKYWFNLITVRMVNSKEEGNFYDGFAPDGKALDDLVYNFDDRREMCLREAIRYLETGSFSGDNKALPFAPVKIFSEKHSLLNNAIIEKN